MNNTRLVYICVLSSFRLTVQNFEKYPISVFPNLIISSIEIQQKSVWNFEATYIFPNAYNKFGVPLRDKTFLILTKIL